MKTKDNKNKKIIIVFAVIILIAVLIYVIFFMKSKNNYIETISAEQIKISNAEQIDVENIINKNTSNSKREEIIQEEADLEYITTYKMNKDLPKGEIQVIQEGREGKQLITKKVVYENNEVLSEEQLGSKVTKSSINKIVEIGDASYTSNYKVKVGDILYVTSDRLAVMTEPNTEAIKVATLSQNDEMKLLEINNDWYRILSGSYTGWVKKECTTYINPNKNEEYNRKRKRAFKRAIKIKIKFRYGIK